MNERMKKIMDFERQLLQNRMQLQHLIEESEFADDELMQAKLKNFQREIRYMEGQLESLKRYSETKCEEEQKEPFVVEVSEPVELTEIVEKHPMTESVPEPERPSIARQVAAKVTQPLPKKDLEKTIGKSLMGIVASVLIFISIVLFANLILPYFNDFAKMICMYLISFGFLVIGLAKMNKDQNNKFYIALAGCGVGAIYISLLMSNMYFEIISDIPLFILIAIWVVGVCFLAKLRNKVFQVIGRIGITISVIVGGISCTNSGDESKFIILIIFYVVAAGVFYITHYEREYADNMVSHVFGAIDMLVLAICASGTGLDDYVAPAVLVIVVLAVYIGLALYGSIERSSIGFGICVSIKSYIMFLLTTQLGIPDLVNGCMIFVLSMAIIVAVDFKSSKDNIGKHILTVVLVWLAYWALDMTDYQEYLVVPLFALPLLGYGFLRANEVMKFAGVIAFAMTDMQKFSDGAHLALIILVIATGFFLIYRNKEQYNKYFKLFLHIVSVLLLYSGTEDLVHCFVKNSDLPEVIGFTVVVLFNVAMYKSVFGTNLCTGQREKGVVYNIINAGCMLVGLVFIDYHNDMGIWHMLIIIATLAAFMVNAKNILDKRDNMIGGIYVGIKFLLLMVVILESFDTANYVVSIVCFVMAIVSIVIGFVGQYKSLRIFGLVLSMISTFKLIMVDLSYDNTLGNAMSFFASGVLCFIISLIYNYIDGKIQKKE